MKVARNEKWKKLLGFSFYINIGNFEGFLRNLNLSAKHLFWRCDYLLYYFSIFSPIRCSILLDMCRWMCSSNKVIYTACNIGKLTSAPIGVKKWCCTTRFGILGNFSSQKPNVGVAEQELNFSKVSAKSLYIFFFNAYNIVICMTY